MVRGVATNMLWGEVDLIEGLLYAGSGAKRWRCRYCGEERSGNITRVKAHLLGVTRPDGARLGARMCSSIPADQRERLLVAYGALIAASQCHTFSGEPTAYPSPTRIAPPPLASSSAHLPLGSSTPHRASSTVPQLTLPSSKRSSASPNHLTPAQPDGPLSDFFHRMREPTPPTVGSSDDTFEDDEFVGSTQPPPTSGHSMSSNATTLPHTARPSGRKAYSTATSRYVPSTALVRPASPRSHAIIQTVRESVKHSAQVIASNALSQMFYDLNLPFSIADTQVFRDAMASVAATDPSFKPPSAELLRTTYLRERVRTLTEQLEVLKGAWQTYGCSIMSNGWTDTHNPPVINILVSCCMGTMFLRAVDASEEGASITAEYIYSVIREAIVEVGPANVVQVVTDNAANCRRMGALMMAEFPTIVWTPCAAHCIDLLLHDIGKLEWVLQTTSVASFLVRFVTRKRRALALFRTYSILDLRKPAPTQFAYHLVAIYRLLHAKGALRKMVDSKEFQEWEGASTSDGTRFSSIVFQDDFWQEAEDLSRVLCPLYHALQLVHKEGSTMGLLYEFMDRVGKVFHQPILAEPRMQELRALWQRRWDRFRQPMHSVAHLLHPLWRSESQEEDLRLSTDWFQYMEQHLPRSVDHATLEYERNAFKTRTGIFAQRLALERSTMLTPVSWWQMFGGPTPCLKKLAIRVLSQDCSTSVCKRNWSTWGLIHVKKRNRLSERQCERLVFCNTNSRLVKNLQNIMNPVQVSPDDCMILEVDSTHGPLVSVHPADDDLVGAVLSEHQAELAAQLGVALRGHDQGDSRARTLDAGENANDGRADILD